MIREVNIKVFYELDPDKNFDIITRPEIVEEKLYDEMCEIFSDDEGFQGLRVDYDDWYYDLDEIRDKLSKYVGYYNNQMETLMCSKEDE